MKFFTWLCRKEISHLFEQNGQLTRNLTRAENDKHKAECELGQVKNKLYDLQLEKDKLFIANKELMDKYEAASLAIENLNLDMQRKNNEIEQLQHATYESIARRDELERAAEKLQEKVAFLEKKNKRHNGYFDKESKDMKTVLYELENEIFQLKESNKKKNLKLNALNLKIIHFKRTTKALDSLRNLYVNYVIKTVLMMCEIKETFSKKELCKIFDVSIRTLENTGINEVNHTKKSVCLVYSSAEVKRFIMENKLLREVLFSATKAGKIKTKVAAK